MEWGERLESYEMLLRNGNLREEHIEPDIGPFQYYVECFFEINTSRSTISLAPIPFTSIVEYAKVYKIEDVEEFLYNIRVMDNVYLKHKEKKSAKNDSN